MAGFLAATRSRGPTARDPSRRQTETGVRKQPFVPCLGAATPPIRFFGETAGLIGLQTARRGIAGDANGAGGRYLRFFALWLGGLVDNNDFDRRFARARRGTRNFHCAPL